MKWKAFNPLYSISHLSFHFRPCNLGFVKIESCNGGEEKRETDGDQRWRFAVCNSFPVFEAFQRLKSSVDTSESSVFEVIP